jgi:hypothetical protein
MVSLKDFAKTFLLFAKMDKKNVHFLFGSPTFEKMHQILRIQNIYFQSNLKKLKET